MVRKLLAVFGGVSLLAAAAISASAARGPSAVSPRPACPADYHPVLDPSHFVAAIDNPYFPLPVGRVLVYRGVKDGRTQVDRVTVTNRTKVIEGIAATDVSDVAKHHGALLEKTKDWYAQDDQGNVWYLGEDTKAYLPDGTIDTSGSWQAGVHGGEPGIIMEADPKVPDAYWQECLSGEAMDTAWVVGVGGMLRVPYGPVHHVLRTLEFTQLEPAGVDRKVYALGVGIVLEQTMAGGTEYAKLVGIPG